MNFKHGRYRTPPMVVPGTYLICEIRGRVKVIGLSDAPIPWPIGELDGKQALIVYRSLARAVRLETPEAVAEVFGVTATQVKAWKESLPEFDGPEPRIKTRENIGRPWTPEEEDLIARLPVKEVAKRTKRTVGAVRAHIHKFYRGDKSNGLKRKRRKSASDPRREL